MSIEKYAEKLYTDHATRKMGRFNLEVIPFEKLPEEVRGCWSEYAKLELMPASFVERFNSPKQEG